LRREVEGGAYCDVAVAKHRRRCAPDEGEKRECGAALGGRFGFGFEALYASSVSAPDRTKPWFHEAFSDASRRPRSHAS
jgi:hypothetical protein